MWIALLINNVMPPSEAAATEIRQFMISGISKELDY